MQKNVLLWQKLLNSCRLFINVLLALIFMFLSLSIKNPVLPKTVAYGFIREAAKKNLDLQTHDWLLLQGDNFIVKYKGQNSEVAPLVLKTAEETFSEVNNILQYSHNEKVPVIIYPDKQSLGKSFGWDADESAMGVYWAGVIRVLSPTEWIESSDEKEFQDYFRKNGPMAHEYAHLVVDYKTKGNYPRWFTEGVAQLVEREITGFQFAPIKSTEKWYDLKKMDRGFDELPDQSLAYGQSLAMIEFLVEQYGENKLQSVMERLGEGKTITGAFQIELGINLDQFQSQFKNWMLTKDN